MRLIDVKVNGRAACSVSSCRTLRFLLDVHPSAIGSVPCADTGTSPASMRACRALARASFAAKNRLTPRLHGDSFPHDDMSQDGNMPTAKYIQPYVEHGRKSGKVRKITVSIPMHVLRLLSDERTRRQVSNLRHATNSDLLCEAFLHAFTGQPLPTDEELRRTMATKKAAAKKPAKKAARKTAKAKTATARKTARKTVRKAVKKVAKKPAAKRAAKKTARKRTAKKAVMAKTARASKTKRAKK
jgi:MetJ family transcriptional regulator, methionine regulon repressor